MVQNNRSFIDAPVFRVDKFVVPDAARSEFVARVLETHEVLREQEGFMGDRLLEQSSGPGEFNFVTIVQWRSQEDVNRAGQAIAALRRRTGFDPHVMFARLGIKADLGNYALLPEEYLVAA
jgi:heme-degrading monooxygenase HmoA